MSLDAVDELRVRQEALNNESSLGEIAHILTFSV